MILFKSTRLYSWPKAVHSLISYSLGYKRHNQVNQANSMVRVRVRLVVLSKYIKTIYYIGICMRVSAS